MLKNLISKSGFLSKGSFGLLHNSPLRNFGIRTAQATRLTSIQELSTFDREKLKGFQEIMAPEQIAELAAREAAQKAQEYNFNNKFNEKNPANRVAVKINAPQGQDIPSDLNAPFVVYVQPRKEKTIIIGRRRKLRTSLPKLCQYQRHCSGLHVLDAISFLESSDTKAAEYIKKTIIQTRRHAIDKGYDPERLYVNAVVGGKQSRIKRIRYHAKGKHGIMIRDTTQLLVKLECRSPEELYQSFFEKKKPITVLSIIREDMAKADVNLETLNTEGFLLTARGRQQKKLMIKRRAQIIHQKFKENGVPISVKTIQDYLLNKLVKEMAERYNQRKRTGATTSLDKRLEVFKKNEAKA